MRFLGHPCYRRAPRCVSPSAKEPSCGRDQAGAKPALGIHFCRTTERGSSHRRGRPTPVKLNLTDMNRKPNAEQRRRELCDAAIELLAEDGARGVTHLRVDRRAGVADGTTSFYFQSRSALLRGVTDRVVSLDVADFTAALDETNSTQDHQARSLSLLSRLAEQAMRTAIEPERSRARARFELFMLAARDPELGQVFSTLMDRFVAISEEAVAQLQSPGMTLDEELIRQQAFAVVTFLAGFLFRLANGVGGLKNAEQLEAHLRAIIAGVAVEHDRITAAG
jgi:DNA-binding transcriptional regulator YbjK